MSIVSILIAIVIFSLLVFFHELGHFLMAKACGIGVIEFSIGMGPRLLSFKIGETRYSLKAIPFGGSCAMVGEDAAGAGEIGVSVDDDSIEFDTEKSFANKSVGARILTVFGGPLFNFILAFILGVILTASLGSNDAIVTSISTSSKAYDSGLQKGDRILSINGHSIMLGTEINLVTAAFPIEGSDVEITYERDGKEYKASYDPSYEVYLTGITYRGTDDAAELLAIEEGSPAEKAGLKVGDVLIGVNDSAISCGNDLARYISENPFSNKEVTMTVLRDGEVISTTLTPVYKSGTSLGFNASVYNDNPSLGDVLSGGIKQTVYGVKAVFYSLKMIFGGQASVKDLSGPVGIVRVIGTTIDTTASEGISIVVYNMLSLSILLSANLGIVNLFPFPALDGGRLLLLIVEGITKKKLPPKAEAYVNMIGFAFLMALMVYILFNDIMKIFQ